MPHARFSFQYIGHLFFSIIFPPKKEEKTEAENPGQDEWGGVCERGWGWGWLLPCHMVGPGPL